MYLLQGVVAGSLLAFAVTIIYAMVEMRQAVATARAGGFRSDFGLDLSSALRDPTCLSLAVISFAFGFFLVLRLHWRK